MHSITLSHYLRRCASFGAGAIFNVSRALRIAGSAAEGSCPVTRCCVLPRRALRSVQARKELLHGFCEGGAVAPTCAGRGNHISGGHVCSVYGIIGGLDAFKEDVVSVTECIQVLSTNTRRQ